MKVGAEIKILAVETSKAQGLSECMLRVALSPKSLHDGVSLETKVRPLAATTPEPHNNNNNDDNNNDDNNNDNDNDNNNNNNNNNNDDNNELI